MILTAKQARAWFQILEDPGARRVLFDGGARSTKTALICLWLLVQAATYPGALILMARKHREHARKSLWDDTLRKLTRGQPDFRMRDGDMEIDVANGSTIRVDGLDDEARVDKILGTEYDHVFFNEATQLSWQTVCTVLTRLARATVPNRKAFFDCNPKSQRHWLYNAGVLHQDPDAGTPLPDAAIWRRQHWTPADNPHLPADALATLQALPGVQRRRMLLGEWCEAEGAVYAFDEDLHTFTDLPPGFHTWRKVRGIDFGYTNPFVCLWGAIDPDGRLWIYRERYLAGVTVQKHAEAINAADPGPFLWTVADHDAEDRATLHAAGIPTIPARKGVARGIQAVQTRMQVAGDGRPRLLIRTTCVETIAEEYDYAWAPPAEGRAAKEAPVKDRDHALDGIRYMVMALDGAPALTGAAGGIVG